MRGGAYPVTPPDAHALFDVGCENVFMWALGIETSNPAACAPAAGAVALARLDGAALVRHDFEPVSPVRPAEDDLIPAIDRLFRRAQASRRDLRRVCVSIGPGGFTALRIAVAATKFIAEATGAACVGVPTALALSLRVREPGPFAIALASKGDTAHITRFLSPGVMAGPGTICSAADIPRLGVGLLVGDSHLPRSLFHAASESGVRVIPPVFDAFCVLEAGQGLQPVDPAELSLLYPREPEAVTKWRALHGKGPSSVSPLA